MLQNDVGLEHSYAVLAKLCRLRETSATQPLWPAAGRKDVVEGIENQIRKIEQEIGDYLSARPEKVA